MTWVYKQVDENDRSSGMAWIIKGKECEITIVPRPHYCDRGNWLAYLEPFGKLYREIDHADGWPRFYFDIDRAKLECEAWLQKRRQCVEVTERPSTIDPQGRR